MKQYDKNIKDALHSKMERISNPDFAENIVSQHLSKKKGKAPYVQFDFTSLMVGLIIVIASLGVGVLITTEKISGFTFDHFLILNSVTVIYLIYRLLNEITTPNNIGFKAQLSQKKRQ